MGAFYILKKIIILIMALAIVLTGCSKLKLTDKVKDLDFTVVDEKELPEELLKLIEEKKQGEFRLTYSDDVSLYIAVGFGTQPTGGYSIQVKELYLTENSIYIDTDLLGPESGTEAETTPSFPYIVVKTEMRKEPVVFR